MSPESARAELEATRQRAVPIGALRDQAWAAVAEHREEIERQCDNYSLPPVVRMALNVVAAEILRRQADVAMSEAESMLPPVK